MQLEIALLICNQIVVPIATIWLQQLKVANIAAVNCTRVALGLLIFAVLTKRQFRQTAFYCLTLRDGSLAGLGPTESYNTSLERSKLNLVRFELKYDLATSEIL